MKLRIFAYLGILAIFVVGTLVKARVIDAKRGAPVTSILNEWNAHGKPVETYTVNRGVIGFYERFTVTTSGHGLVAEIPRSIKEKLRTGLPAIVHVGDGSVRGRVANISAVPSRTTGLYTAVIEPQEGPGEAKGNFVVDVEVSRLSDVVRIPLSAVQRSNEGSKVWRLRDNRAEPVQVNLGRSSSEYVQVLAGLQPGDQVVVRGQAMLEPEEAVRVVRTGGLQ